MELWDLYDLERNPLNKTHKRGVPLQDEEYHIVTDVWTVREDGKVLITKRHPDKIWGNKWECTGGSALAGETSKQSTLRELQEEVGISAEEGELELLHTIRVKDRFIDTYAIVKNVSRADLVLQKEEVVDAKFVDFEELNRIWEEHELVPRERYLLYRDLLQQFIEKNRKEGA